MVTAMQKKVKVWAINAAGHEYQNHLASFVVAPCILSLLKLAIKSVTR